MIVTTSQIRRLGYARVSTYGQTLDGQLEEFHADGCRKVDREKASGLQGATGATYSACRMPSPSAI